MQDLSKEELLAMLATMQQDKDALASQVASLQKNKKTKRKKPTPPTHYDYDGFYPLLCIPSKLPHKEKKELIEKLLAYGVPDEDYAKYLIKTAKQGDGISHTLYLWKTEQHREGKSKFHTYIMKNEPYMKDVVVKLPNTPQGALSTFSLMGKVDNSPDKKGASQHADRLPFWKYCQDYYIRRTELHNSMDNPLAPYGHRPENDKNFGVWFASVVAHLDEPIFIPTDKDVVKRMMKPTREEMKKIFEWAVFGSWQILHDPENHEGHNAVLNPHKFLWSKIFVSSPDKLLREKKGKGEWVGTTKSNQVDENGNKVVADFTKLEDRKKYIKIKYDGKKRCDCLLEKEGKQRCTGEAKWRLPNGKAFCSHHAGKILQTHYLLSNFAPESAELKDYACGVRAGWCEKNCEGHTCKCKKNTNQQKLCKNSYKGMNETQLHEYKCLSKRAITCYSHIFEKYEIDE
jgi:hypothetical protein